MVRAVVFDLDGTLFDDRQYVRAGVLNAAAWLEAETGRDLGRDFLEAYFQDGIRDRTFDVVLARHGLSQEYVPELIDAYHAHDDSLVPYPDTNPVLAALAQTHALGLVTGGTNGRAKLQRLGLTSYFDSVYVTATSGTSKRDPDPFLGVLSELDVASSQSVYVGDRPSLDFVQPNRLGMDTIRIRRGQYADRNADGDARPDVVLESLANLPDALGDIE